ncbi:MAG: hypothetical protein OXN91_09025 [Chloroflexota bacterium]|nr:hypothetical protein [Chloroflexota bacterium]
MAKLPDHRRNVALVGVAESAVEAIRRDNRTTSDTRGVSAYPTRPSEPHAINPFSVSLSNHTSFAPASRARALLCHSERSAASPHEARG